MFLHSDTDSNRLLVSMGKTKAGELQKIQDAMLARQIQEAADKAAEMPPPAAAPARRHSVKAPLASPPASTCSPSTSASGTVGQKRSADGEHPEGVPKAKAKAKVKAKAASKAAAKAKPQPEIAEPDFEICWENHAKLMEHFNLSDKDATACLLAVVGPDPRGEKFWTGYKAKLAENASTVEDSQVDPPLPDEEEDGDLSLGPGDDESLGEDEDEDDDEIEAPSVSSGSGDGPDPPANGGAVRAERGSPIDRLETQPAGHVEPVVASVGTLDESGTNRFQN